MKEELKKDFLDAMKKTTSTVTVIASKDNQVQQAMTATSVVSLSLEPPSMLICINNEASIQSILEKGKKISINILSIEQKDLSDLCSDKAKEKLRFDGEHWDYHEDIPYSPKSVSNLFCECVDSYKYETHRIYLCKVLSLINNDSRDPLLYHNGSYNV